MRGRLVQGIRGKFEENWAKLVNHLRAQQG
jgi:hypothetical protein